MLEAHCSRCHEVFVPQGVEPDDLIHGDNYMGEFCGGIGIIAGEWTPPEGTPQYHVGDMILTPQEIHGMESPECSDPDCEHHHPEVRES